MTLTFPRADAYGNDPSWAVGRRDAFTDHAFTLDLASRLANKVQLATDGHKVYLGAVEGAFGNDIDYAMLVKMYEGDSGKKASAEVRYSPAQCTGAKTQKITGNPDAAHISTNYTERANLTMRMHMRRFTRLTLMRSQRRWTITRRPWRSISCTTISPVYTRRSG